jgi:hypothetical protein
MQMAFGPTLGAGTRVNLRDGVKTISPSALGSTFYAGVLERGTLGTVLAISGEKDLERKTGGYIPDSLLPDAAKDFFKFGEGSGTLFLYRVTDGTEETAGLDVFDRHQPQRQYVMDVDSKDGGAWGGKRDVVLMDLDAVGDIAETAITLPALYICPANKWRGATVTISVTGDTYTVLSNTEGKSGSPAVLTLTADSTADTDFGIETDTEIVLKQTNTDSVGRVRNLAVVFKDGQLNPGTHWGLEVWLNDEKVRDYPDLSSDPNARDYYIELVNTDPENHYVTLTDNIPAGTAITAAHRPANHYGTIPAAGVTALGMTLKPEARVVYTDVGAGGHVVDTFTFGANVIRQQIVLVAVAAGNWTVTSSAMPLAALPNVSGASPITHVAHNSYTVGFKMTEGGVVVAGDTVTIDIIPLETDEAINGKVFPDAVNNSTTSHTISDNDETTITVASGDLTVVGAAADQYRLEFKQSLSQGFDNPLGVAGEDYMPAFDVNSSKLNNWIGKGFGLIKCATPGIIEAVGSSDAISVQKAGIAYCAAKAFQFRTEIDKDTTDEFVARTYIHDTIGKSPWQKVCFPSYAYVSDPLRKGRLKQVPITGKLHGIEARTARNFQGYGKVAAGSDAILYDVKKLAVPSGADQSHVFNGELLNPAGIQWLKTSSGNLVVYGARIPTNDPEWVFCQHLELIAHYVHVMAVSFDWIHYAINDEEEWPKAAGALQSYFRVEWNNRMLQGDTLEEAAGIKVDEENNSAAVRATGEAHADLTLWPADTIEKFVIGIGKRGFFVDKA